MSRLTSVFCVSTVSIAPAFAVLAAGCGGAEANNASQRCGGPGIICSYAGDGRAALGVDGVAPGEVSLYLPQDVTFGPDGLAYVLDWNNHRVRVLDEAVRTLIGTGELGDAPDGPALKTRLNHPTHIAFSPEGTLILSAWHNSKVMEMDMDTGRIETICGNGERSYGGEGGPASEAVVDLPVATAFDSEGRLYIMDQGNQRIRRMEHDGTLATIVGPVGAFRPEGYVEVCEQAAEEYQAPECRFCLEEEADDPECTGPPARPQGFAGDGVAGVEVYMNLPFSQSAPPSGRMEMGPADTLYFADTGNHLIRAVRPDGTVVTVAGVAPEPYDATELDTKTPEGGFAGDGGPALEARFNHPRDVAVAEDGTIYVADTDNSCVRKVGPDGTVSTVAGVCGERGYDGDGGPATEAKLDRPYGIGLDDQGNLYVVDTYNHRVRVVYEP